VLIACGLPKTEEDTFVRWTELSRNLATLSFSSFVHLVSDIKGLIHAEVPLNIYRIIMKLVRN
jgi:hypothetical protein